MKPGTMRQRKVKVWLVALVSIVLVILLRLDTTWLHVIGPQANNSGVVIASENGRVVLGLIIVLIALTALLLPLITSMTAIEQSYAPELFREPPTRSCSACGKKHPATLLVCTNELHPEDHSRDLHDHFITRETTRVWGIRFLAGLMLSTALGPAPQWTLYAVFAASIVWLLVPMLVSKPAGLTLFLLCALAGLGAVGAWKYALSPAWAPWLAAQDRWFLWTIVAGPFRFVLDTGLAARGALFLNAAVLAAAVIGILMSVRVSVSLMGLFVIAVGLFCLSEVQGLYHLAYLYFIGVVFTFGWLLSMFVGLAIIDSRGKFICGPFVRPLRLSCIPRPRRLRARQLPPSRPGLTATVDQMVYALETIVAALANVVTRIIVDITNITVGLIERVVNSLLWVVNRLVTIVVWTALFTGRVAQNLVWRLRTSLVLLYQLAMAGCRLSVIAPFIMVASGALLAVAASSAWHYLASGDWHSIVQVIGAYCGALGATVLAATIFIGRDVIVAVLGVSLEYLGNLLITFIVVLDCYGIQRRAFGLPSHFGTMSWTLNGLAVSFVVYTVLRQNSQSSFGASGP